MLDQLRWTEPPQARLARIRESRREFLKVFLRMQVLSAVFILGCLLYFFSSTRPVALPAGPLPRGTVVISFTGVLVRLYLGIFVTTTLAMLWFFGGNLLPKKYSLTESGANAFAYVWGASISWRTIVEFEIREFDSAAGLKVLELTTQMKDSRTRMELVFDQTRVSEADVREVVRKYFKAPA